MFGALSRRAAISGGLVLLFAAGCTSYDRADAESTIVNDLSKRVEKFTGSPIESASCPEEVELEAGARFECTATLGDGSEIKIDGAVRDDGGLEMKPDPKSLGEAADL